MKSVPQRFKVDIKARCATLLHNKTLFLEYLVAAESRDIFIFVGVDGKWTWKYHVIRTEGPSHRRGGRPQHKRPAPAITSLVDPGAKAGVLLLGGLRWLAARLCVCSSAACPFECAWYQDGIISMDHLSRRLSSHTQRRTQDGVSPCRISGSPRLRLS